LKTDVGVTNTAKRLFVEIFEPADIVNDREGLDVIEESVDREVASLCILFWRAEGIILCLVKAVCSLALLGLTPEGAGLYDLLAEDDVRQAEATANEEAVSEDFTDFIGTCIRADVKIFGLTAEQ
jgi:hypothetical protein